MTTNVSEVLAVPELLETILLQLPLLNLLLVQRVSTYWRDAIKNSPRIQQALFFKPTPSNRSSKPTLNSLLHQILFDPLGESDGPALRGIHDAGDCGKVVEGDFHFHIMACDECCDTFHVAPSGSWAEMLVSDPPCPIIMIEHDDHLWEGEERTFVVKTLGELVGKLEGLGFVREADEDDSETECDCGRCC